MVLAPLFMHIPDGFLSTLVSILAWLFSMIVVAIALRRTGRELGERDVPLMGVLAAAIFAGQMLNFTVAGGTSGHMLGAALATILLGPWPAVLVMTAVVSVQALLFQDGGLLSLGANILNMGVIGVAVSYAIYQLIKKLARGKTWGIFSGGFLAAWFSIVISSLSVALQLALSGTSPANLAIPAMAGIHALIGIGEGLITIGALSFIYASRKDLLKSEAPQPSGNRMILIGGLAFALLLAVLAPLASANPDGLMKVAEQQGFLSTSQSPLFNLIPGYLLPGISNKNLATVLAGILGVIIVFLAVFFFARTQKEKSRKNNS
jgi:cobalt/nickel transport system permease protein